MSEQTFGVPMMSEEGLDSFMMKVPIVAIFLLL